MYIDYRINSSSSTDGDDILPENTFDVEKNLCASAIKNNLDDVSVKKILKVCMYIIVIIVL